MNKEYLRIARLVSARGTRSVWAALCIFIISKPCLRNVLHPKNK